MLKGKVALVTGGARGIGKAVVQRFLAEGMHVIVWDKEAPPKRRDSACTIMQIDVRDEQAIAAAVAPLSCLDIVVNNAGVYQHASVEEMAKGDLDTVVDTNLKAPFLVCKHTLPLLRASRGTIINIASGLGQVAEPQSPAYCASKAGLIMLTKCLAQSYGPQGLRVNAVLPGPIDTELLRVEFPTPEQRADLAARLPLRRLGSVDDVAQMVAFLASNTAAAYINGGVFAVDGGETAGSIYG